jgi:YihY family inner membrane protein
MQAENQRLSMLLRFRRREPPQGLFFKKHIFTAGCASFASSTLKSSGSQSKETPVASVSNSGTCLEPEVETAPVIDAAGAVVPPATQSKWYRWRHDGAALVNYLLDSEVHTYAFSVAANAILSFIPFIVLLYTLAISVFHSPAMAAVVTDMVRYFLPSNQEFVAINLQIAAAHQGIRVFSLVMILVACTGIFLPLEVALNQAWGITKSRNYLFNQVVAFGLATLMVALGMMSVLLSAWQRQLLTYVFFHHTDNFVFNGISYMWLAFSTGIACILFFFSIYWLLPNCKVPAKPVMRTAIITGIIWLLSKYVFVMVLPHLDLKALYGPFYVSVGLLFWAYVSGLILFAGAQYSVSRMGSKQEPQPRD